MTFNELIEELSVLENDLHEIKLGNGAIKHKGKIVENRAEIIEEIEDYIFRLSYEIFHRSKTENEYWSYCSIATYKSFYEIRLAAALNNDNNNTNNETEFVESEIRHLTHFKNSFSSSKYHPDLFNPIEKKIKFLLLKKQQLNPVNEEQLLDFSDSKASEKIIYLHKLGVLDFLRKTSPFAHSTYKLAEFLSAVTGEKASTLQSYLNPIYSNLVDQKNNPLAKKTSVERVQKQLNLMGI